MPVTFPYLYWVLQYMHRSHVPGKWPDFADGNRKRSKSTLEQECERQGLPPCKNNFLDIPAEEDDRSFPVTTYNSSRTGGISWHLIVFWRGRGKYSERWQTHYPYSSHVQREVEQKTDSDTDTHTWCTVKLVVNYWNCTTAQSQAQLCRRKDFLANTSSMHSLHIHSQISFNIKIVNPAYHYKY